MFNQQGGAECHGHFTDAGLEQRHISTVQSTAVNFATGAFEHLQIADLVTQDGDFLLHCANNAYFHGIGPAKKENTHCEAV